MLYNATVYKDAGGQPLGLFAAVRDVTAQTQASQYARSLIEASRDPLVTISPDGKITDVNAATLKVTGVVREKLDLVRTGEKFDVILCDLMMPLMTGIEFHKELSVASPAQAERVVFLTGGAFTPSARAFLDEVSNVRIEKPFDVQSLRDLVNARIGVEAPSSPSPPGRSVEVT